MKIFSALFIVVCLPYLSYCQQGDNVSMVNMFCENCTQICIEEPPPYSDCPNPDFCKPSEGNNLGLTFGLTIGAGFSTNIGALLSFLPCFKRSNVTLLAVGLALAAGFMVYISFVDILGKAGAYFCCNTQEHCTLAATGCFFLGIVLTLVLQFLLDSLQKLDLRPPWSKKKSKTDSELGDQEKKTYSTGSMMKSLKTKLTGKSFEDDGASKEEKTLGVPNITVEGEKAGETKFDSTADSEIIIVTDENSEKPDETAVTDPEEYEEVMDLLGKDAKDLHRMGLFTAAAIAIHNFPEGIATFIVGLATPALGIALVVAIAVHNIPEGASVAIPIYYATVKKWKGLLWAFLSGVSEPFGALLAYLVFKDIFGPLAYGFIFGLVGGMMVIVALKDLLPTARKFDKHGLVVTSFFILGMFIMAASLVFFEYGGTH